MAHNLQVLSFAVIMTSLTVFIHALGMYIALHRFTHIWPREVQPVSVLRGQWLMLRLVALMLGFHFLEATLWGVGLHVLRVFPNFETAIYFSASTYTTVGYGDVLLPEPWRLLAPVEGMLGLLMFGWSTGVLVALVMRIYERHRGILTG